VTEFSINGILGFNIPLDTLQVILEIIYPVSQFTDLQNWSSYQSLGYY